MSLISSLPVAATINNAITETRLSDSKTSLPSLISQLSGARSEITFAAWKSLQESSPGSCIVHALQAMHQDGPLFDASAQSVFAGWDVISASLIDLTAISEFPAELHPGGTSRNNQMIGEIGFILDVPAQNIYGTHSKDNKFDNHVGTVSEKDPSELSRRLHKEGVSRFVSPKEMLDGRSGDYNELLIIGREGVNIHAGEPATKEIKVVGILSARTDKYPDGPEEDRQQKHHMELIKKIQHVNPELKVFSF